MAAKWIKEIGEVGRKERSMHQPNAIQAYS